MVSIQNTLFKLTQQDFDSCRKSKTVNHIKLVADKFKNQLVPELLASLPQEFQVLQTKNKSPYVARPWSPRIDDGSYRDHMWLGLAHSKFDDPRKGVQFQFGINKKEIFTYGIWLSGPFIKRNLRESIIKNIQNNIETYLDLLHQLTDDYFIYSEKRDRIKANVIDETELNNIMTDIMNGIYVDVRRIIGVQYAISLGNKMVEHIVQTFVDLFPIYNIMIGESLENSENNTSYFILRTGGGEYKDDPEIRYNFRSGIPGSTLLRDAVGNAFFVYYEVAKGGFWAKGSIGNNLTGDKDSWFIDIHDFEEIGPFSFEKVQPLSFTSIGQAGIRKISKVDYLTILGILSDEEIQEYTEPDLTLYDEDFVTEVESLLLSKRQIIFQGPPGTSKTHFAIQLAKKHEGKNPKLIQFHPSYSYENFVEGLTVKSKGQFDPIPMIFLRKCQEARDNLGKNVFLIIDEINRGLLGKIFGELIIGLEYRETQRFELPYSGKSMSIPSNVILIGTMNTADRSIALVDYALRRRFFFIDMMPDVEILRGWLDIKSTLSQQEKDKVITLFSNINEAIKNDASLGENFQVGHTYYFIENIDQMAIQWKYAIRPLIKEYFFGDGDKLETYDSVWQQFNAQSEE